MIFSSYDKKEIYVREWTDVAEPCGVVQIAHGMNEYAARYDAFARRLNEMGYAVVADDHRGHGDTDAETLGYAEGEMFSDTVKDMAGIAKYYREKFSGVNISCSGFPTAPFLRSRSSKNIPAFWTARSSPAVRGRTRSPYTSAPSRRASAGWPRGKTRPPIL